MYKCDLMLKIVTLHNMEQVRAGILGASGIVGQHFVQSLANHDKFEITAMAELALSRNYLRNA